MTCFRARLKKWTAADGNEQRPEPRAKLYRSLSSADCMFGTRPTGRLYYVWEFAEVRWRKSTKSGRSCAQGPWTFQHVCNRFLTDPVARVSSRSRRPSAFSKRMAGSVSHSAMSESGRQLIPHWVRRRSGGLAGPVLLPVAPQLLFPSVGLGR